MNNRIIEIILEHILWNIRFNAYKKVNNTKKNVVDGLTQEDQRMLMFIYNQYNQLHMQRVMSNPTVQKLLVENYISHE
jgi:hypothetical protein